MKHRNIDSIERGINLVRKLRGYPRRTKLNRDSYHYRVMGGEVVELSMICDLWKLEKRFSDDTAKKMNDRDGTQLTGIDLEDEGFVPDFTEAAYKIAFEMDRGFFVSVYENDRSRVEKIFQEWNWIDEIMDEASNTSLYRRSSDYPAQNEKEKTLLSEFKPNQRKAAKAAAIVAKNFPGMTPELALKIVKNSLI